MTGWWVSSSSPTVSTIQSNQTVDFRVDRKQAVSVGISDGIVPLRRSLATLVVSTADSGLPSLHPKIPFPGAGARRVYVVWQTGNNGSLGN